MIIIVEVVNIVIVVVVEEQVGSKAGVVLHAAPVVTASAGPTSAIAAPHT